MILENLELDVEDSITGIKRICFRRDSLCIGAVSSPVISNIVMYSFDVSMMGYCEKMNLQYSRYADDIYISSSDYIDKKIIGFLEQQLKNIGLSLNRSKTSFYSPKYRRVVTGIVITNDSRISVGTKRRNEIKQMIYKKLVHGEGDSNQIIGYLSFLKDIEPQTYNSIVIKYSRFCEGDIIEALKK